MTQEQQLVWDRHSGKKPPGVEAGEIMGRKVEGDNPRLREQSPGKGGFAVCILRSATVGSKSLRVGTVSALVLHCSKA